MRPLGQHLETRGGGLGDKWGHGAGTWGGFRGCRWSTSQWWWWWWWRWRWWWWWWWWWCCWWWGWWGWWGWWWWWFQGGSKRSKSRGSKQSPDPSHCCDRHPDPSRVSQRAGPCRTQYQEIMRNLLFFILQQKLHKCSWSLLVAHVLSQVDVLSGWWNFIGFFFADVSSPVAIVNLRNTKVIQLDSIASIGLGDRYVRYQDRHGYQFFSPSSYRLKCQKHPKAFSAQGQYFWFRVIKATKNDCVQGLQDQKNQGLLAPKKCRCFSYNDVDTFSCPKTPFMPAKKVFDS